MFDKSVYIARRKVLASKISSGVVLMLGNSEAGCNYTDNTYVFRQDSTFLYFFGLHREGLVGVIDVDNNQEYLLGNDIDIEDIVWYGQVDSVADMAAQTGVEKSAPISQLEAMVDKAKKTGQKIHFLPPYRHDLMIQLMDLTGIHPAQQREAASLDLIMAVVNQRSINHLLRSRR